MAPSETLVRNRNMKWGGGHIKKVIESLESLHSLAPLLSPVASLASWGQCQERSFSMKWAAAFGSGEGRGCDQVQITGLTNKRPSHGLPLAGSSPSLWLTFHLLEAWVLFKEKPNRGRMGVSVCV